MTERNLKKQLEQNIKVQYSIIMEKTLEEVDNGQAITRAVSGVLFSSHTAKDTKLTVYTTFVDIVLVYSAEV